MKRTAYEKTSNRLQMELCQLQRWVKEKGSASSDRETSQVYMQRYLKHFPSAGEVVIFDRSWYNRAGVEPVMGFCTPAAPALPPDLSRVRALRRGRGVDRQAPFRRGALLTRASLQQRPDFRRPLCEVP
jgi:polyphosphate kinase 2 (PPK2 family)